MIVASLYNHKQQHPNTQIAVMIDELHTQNLSDLSPITKIMREGRKLHIAFIGATQKYRIKGDRVSDVMQLADTKIFLKPTRDSTEDVRKTLGFGQKNGLALNSMTRGDCFVSGNLYNRDTSCNCSAVIRGRVFDARDPEAGDMDTLERPDGGTAAIFIILWDFILVKKIRRVLCFDAVAFFMHLWYNDEKNGGYL